MQSNAIFRRVIGGLITVRSIFVVIALALVGSLGEAAAQSYPPDYYTPPPPGYYPPPQPYSSAPLPPLDVGAPATEQPGGPYRTPPVYHDANGAPVQPYGPDDDEGQPGAYPPARPPISPRRTALRHKLSPRLAASWFRVRPATSPAR